MQQRTIRSFVRREGRMTTGQKKALESLWPRYGINKQTTPVVWSDYFHRQAPLVLEIGFGMGASLLTMAQQQPEMNFIGVEVYRPGVGTLLAAIEKEQVDNIRLICDDAVDVLQQMIAQQSLSRVQIYFPDPWPKKRHHKRRLIQTELVTLICDKLIPQGILHLATDWQDYAEHMMTVLSESADLINTCGEGQYAPRPTWRPETKFEKRGQGLGHGVWDLVFEKR